MINIKYTTGYAGTGKSTELLKLLKSFKRPEKVVVLAPTPKALARLRKEGIDDRIVLRTVHSLLGWIPTINEDAKHARHIDSTIKLDTKFNDYDHLIIDEAGMLSEEMLYDIVDKLETYADLESEKIITLYLYLDPYQLKPVKGQQIQVDAEHTTNLTIQHRAESLDIVETYTKFVHYIEGKQSDDLTIKPSENIKFLDSIEEFKQGDRLLAYTNDCVGYYNKLIAKKFGIEGYLGQEVHLGNEPESFIPQEYISPNITELMEWFENGKLKLQNSQINSKFLEASLQAL